MYWLCFQIHLGPVLALPFKNSMILNFLGKLLNLSKPDLSDPVLIWVIQDNEYLPTSTPCPTPASTPMPVSWSWAGTRSDPTFSFPASGSWFLPLSASGSWLLPIPTPGSWLLPLSASTTMTPEIKAHKISVKSSVFNYRHYELSAAYTANTLVLYNWSFLMKGVTQKIDLCSYLMMLPRE